MRVEASGLSGDKKTSSLKSPEEFNSEPTLSKGRFLVASRNMKDTRFSRSVILLITHIPENFLKTKSFQLVSHPILWATLLL
jgi:hypothetical protein